MSGFSQFLKLWWKRLITSAKVVQSVLLSRRVGVNCSFGMFSVLVMGEWSKSSPSPVSQDHPSTVWATSPLMNVWCGMEV